MDLMKTVTNFLGVYKNALGVQDGLYKNDDGVLPTVWVRVVGSDIELVTNIKQLANEKLTRNIYFSATNFPHTNRYDCFSTSVFDGWMVPSTNYIFEVDDKTVTVTEMPKSIPFGEYKSLVYENTKNNILSVYEDGREGVLFYSGGIDSMTLMSFLRKFDLLSRTHIVFSLNATQELAAYRVPTRFAKVKEMERIISGECLSFNYVSTDIADIANVSNMFNGEFSRLLTYCSSHCETMFNNVTFIEGEGDALHLHTKQVMNDILMANGTVTDYSQEQRTDYYSSDASACKSPSYDTGIRNVVFRSKPYRGMNRVNGNKFAQPIINNGGFDLIRSLDMRGVDYRYAVDALLPKEYIRTNVGDSFDGLIMSEYAMDFDIIKDVFVRCDEITISDYEIPTALNHNEDGLRFLQEQYDSLSKDEYINLNSLISIAAMRHLSGLLH